MLDKYRVLPRQHFWLVVDEAEFPVMDGHFLLEQHAEHFAAVMNLGQRIVDAEAAHDFGHTLTSPRDMR